MSTIKVNAIQHTGGSNTALSLSSNGSVTFPNNTIFTSRVGIANTNPQYALDVNGYVRVQNNQRMLFGTTDGGWLDDNFGNGDLLNITGKSSGLRFLKYDVSAEHVRIDSSGRVTTPYQPRFCVRSNVTYNLPASVTEMVHTSTVHNVGGHYSTSTGRFTCPVAGYYRVWTCFHSTHTVSGRHVIAVNGSQVIGSGGGVTSSSGDWRQTNLEWQSLLSAGDYISTFCWSNSYVHGDGAWGNWGAELVS